jgi:hypothetical protein
MSLQTDQSQNSSTTVNDHLNDQYVGAGRLTKKRTVPDSKEDNKDDNEDLIVLRDEYKKQFIHPNVGNFNKIRSSIDRNSYMKWYYDEYMKQWKFNKLPNLLKYTIEPQHGSIMRMDSINAMKYKFNYNTMDMIIVVMKLNDGVRRTETNYGTLFCEIVDGIGPIRRETLASEGVYGQVAFLFYSASPSFISCDGEYRARFSMYRSALTAKREFSDIWHDLEEYVTRIKIRRQWSLYTSYFYPKLEQELKNTDVEYNVKNEMVPMTLLVIAWFQTIYSEMIGSTYTHINQNFRDIFLKDNAETDIHFIKDVIKKYSHERVDNFRARTSHTSSSIHGADRYMQCGYKMIPLNIQQVRDPFKLRYKPWREYFIQNKLNDLVINSIAPGFSIILDCFYIKNSRKGLYDNKSQYDRMKNSEIAKEVVQTLNEAQRNTYFATTSLQSVKKTSAQIKQWISAKFKKLSEKIDDPINYSYEEIIMSEVTLAFVSEYIGRTLADSISLITNNKTYDSILGYPFKEIGYDFLSKYLFEILYNIHCMNTKTGVIHGDLHLNNITIGPLYYPDPTVITNKEKKYRVVYVLDDHHQFVFPNNGYFACIIDFSRGIVNPNMYEVLTDESLPVTYQLVKDEEKFKAAEISALLNLYTQLYNSKNKQREELIVLLKNNYDAVFKLLTCMDVYMFSMRMARILRQVTFPVSKRAIDLIDKINRLSEGYIATEMNHLISDETYAKKILAEDWPIVTIMKKCFSEYNDGQVFKDAGIITDVYCYNNEMKYSVCKHEKFPPILKYAKYYDEKGVLQDIPKIAENRAAAREEYEREKLQNLTMVNYIARRHQEKLL